MNRLFEKLVNLKGCFMGAPRGSFEMVLAEKSREFKNRKGPKHCTNSYPLGISSVHSLTKTSIYGSSVIHSGKTKGEEGLTLITEKEWFTNLGTLSDIGL